MIATYPIAARSTDAGQPRACAEAFVAFVLSDDGPGDPRLLRLRRRHDPASARPRARTPAAGRTSLG